MAKLKFGNITVQATPDKSEAAQPEAFDAMKIVEKVIAMLPKPQDPVPTKEIDLSSVHKKIEDIHTNMQDLNSKLIQTQDQLDSLSTKSIEIPVPKVINYTKDISQDVLAACQRMVKDSEQLNSEAIKQVKLDHEIQVKKQKYLNFMLAVSIGLLALSHLL